MKSKVIKSDAEYSVALAEAERLIGIDPQPNSEDADRLEVLALLIEDYEKQKYQLGDVDPIDAIEFRMAEQQIRQKDLVPMLGTRSRVSEVLSRKRPLTVQMIRALSEGLGIPVASLIGSSRQELDPLNTVTSDWQKFPYKEMEKRGWFTPLRQKGFTTSEELISAFIQQVSPMQEARALFRRTIRGHGSSDKNQYAILAWTARILIRAKEVEVKSKFDLEKINVQWMRNLAQLSWLKNGPLLAVEYLNKYGIVLVVEPHLPNTLIDGAALLTSSGTPVIGLTLRFDRIDNFWFTLLHELAHVWKHLGTSEDMFVDRLDNSEPESLVEKEANRIARDTFIPRAIWRSSPAFLAPSKQNILNLADEMNIHPAIVVGRLHRETGEYTAYRDFLGQGSIRKLFLSE